MLIKESNLQSSFPTKCNECKIEARRLLHHVPRHGTFLRLCTNCVLRIHGQSFCRTCFQLYPPTTPRICPVCANSKQKALQEVDGFKIMERDSAMKLLTAAKISSNLVNEAAVNAREKAEKKAEEAVVARKNAKKAMESFADLVTKDKFEKKQSNGYGFCNGDVNNVSNSYGVENDEDLMELTAEIVELMMDVDDNEGMMD